MNRHLIIPRDPMLLASALRVALARADLRSLRELRGKSETSATDRSYAATVQGRCGRDYRLTASGCLLPS